MKTKTVLFRLIILSELLLLISCSKNNDKENGRVINSSIQKQIEISVGDTLKVNLGNFGDEEGAWIFKNPQNAKISKTYRQMTSSSIIYEYFPMDKFIGKDTVSLILNRDSDGASSGTSDTTKICIIVNP
jgi:hypothetical protein